MRKNPDNPTDAELLEQYTNGDEAAFGEIVNRYKNGLYAFLHRFIRQNALVDDVFQETFIQLFQSIDSFDTSRPLRPWLFTIAANKAKDALRKGQRTAAISIGTMAKPDEMSFGDVLDSLTSDEELPYEKLIEGETADKVREIIANMSENLREILILAYFQKFSYKQMTEILSIPIGTVKSRLHSAVGKFTQEWNASMRNKKK